MSSISEVIQELSYFSYHKNIPEVLIVLESFRDFKTILSQLGISKKIDDETVNSLRSTINNILLDDNNSLITANEIYLPDACHRALLALAEFRPINPEDPISFDKINSKKKVFVSTGHQFDIYTLINYHNDRPCRGDLNEEQYNYKQLINPLTNKKFSYMDSTHIRNVAKQKNIEVRSLVDESCISVINLAERINIYSSRMSIDEIADNLGLLLSGAELYLNKFKYFLMICFVIFGMELMLLGYALDHLVIDASNFLNPSTTRNRAGFLEAGVIIGGAISITSLVAFSMFRIERTDRFVNERDRREQPQLVANH